MNPNPQQKQRICLPVETTGVTTKNSAGSKMGGGWGWGGVGGDRLGGWGEFIQVLMGISIAVLKLNGFSTTAPLLQSRAETLV